MKKRIITGLCMGIVIAPLLYLGGWFTFGLLVVLSYLATMELIKMHAAKQMLSRKYEFILPLISVLLVTTAFLVTQNLLTFNIGDVIFALVVVFMLMMIVPLFNKELKSTDMLVFFGCIVYGGLGIFMAFRARFIGGNISEIPFVDQGLVLMAFVLVSTMFTDMGAYNFGLLFGKHKLCPSISPKKTIEGAIGGSFTGAIFGTAVIVICEQVFNFTLLEINNNILNGLALFGISLLLTVIAQLGDLVASKLKREYEIKDYGFIFPGHGGVMDRFDSLIFTGGTFYLILAIIGVVL